ncbi:MAG: hypothetical protein JRH20_12450 [Deltaproteobacteria bacterium]|nr:hypothetical protein [Deltaproteobacteria bacterium]
MRTHTLLSLTLSMLLAAPAFALPAMKTKARLNKKLNTNTTSSGVFSYGGGYGNMRGVQVVRSGAQKVQRLMIQVEKALTGVPSPSAGILPMKISGEKGNLDIRFSRKHVGHNGKYLRYEVEVLNHKSALSQGDIHAITQNLLGRGASFEAKKTTSRVMPGSGRGEFSGWQGQSIKANWKYNARAIEVSVKAENRGQYQAAKAKAKHEAASKSSDNYIVVRDGNGHDLILPRFIGVNAKTGEIVHTVRMVGQELTPNALHEAVDRLATN